MAIEILLNAFNHLAETPSKNDIDAMCILNKALEEIDPNSVECFSYER